MKKCVVTILFFLTAAAAYAQQDSLWDCKSLEVFFNDTIVSNHLILDAKVTVFLNTSSYFKDCKTVTIRGRVFKIFDTSMQDKLERTPNYMYIVKDQNDKFLIRLIDMAGEREKEYTFRLDRGRFIVKWVHMLLLD